MSEQATLSDFGTASDCNKMVGDIPAEKPHQSEEWLRNQYYEQGKSLENLGELAGVHKRTITRWMDKHGLERRSISQARATGDVEPLKDADWLREQYCECGRTLAEIGSELGVSDVCVGDWMERHGIERRDNTASEVQADGDIQPLKDPEWLREQYIEKELGAPKIAEKLGVSQTPVYTHMEKHGIEPRSHSQARANGDVEPLKDDEWLRQQYNKKGLSQYQIAEELGISYNAVSQWMHNHGIEVRTESERNSGGNITPLKNKKWLKRQYVDRGKSIAGIATELGVSETPVRAYLNDYDVEIRSGGFQPDHLPHRVRSDWELAVANLLRDAEIAYEYESLKIGYGDGRTYTPDFVTNSHVIEVKGYIYRDEAQKAKAAIEQLDERNYVVIGKELPSDIHIPWDKRENLTTHL